MMWFVDAPPTQAKLIPEGFEDAAKGIGYVVEASDAKDAVRIVKAYRRGDAWTMTANIRVVS